MKIADNHGCISSDTLGVTTLEEIEKFFPLDTLICEGDSLSLQKLEEFVYERNNDSTTVDSIIWLDGDSAYFLELSYGSCNWADSVIIDLVQFPEILKGDTVFANDSTTLTAPAGYNHQWSYGSTSQSISVKTSGIYWVELSSMGCTERDSIYVDITNTIGIRSEVADPVRISPIPADHTLIIEFDGSPGATYRIIGVDGRLHHSGMLGNQPNRIDVSELARSTYLVEVQDVEQVYRRLVMIR